jgi:NTE family protein
VYKNSDPSAIYRLDNVLTGVDVGYSTSRFNEIRVGYGVGYQDYALRLGTPDFASTNGRVGAFHARYILNHTNEAVIPTRGVNLNASFEWFDSTPISTHAYPSLQLLVQYFQPVSSRGSLFFTSEGASTFGHSSPGAPIYFLGGVGRLSAYGLNELIGNQYFIGRTGYLHKVFTLPQFVGKQVYVTGFAELGKIYGDPFPAPKLSGDAAGGILAETFFGPILIGGSVGDTGHQKWFFQLGRVF